MPANRRALLRTVGVLATTGVAGCLGGYTGSDEQTEEARTDATQEDVVGLSGTTASERRSGTTESPAPAVEDPIRLSTVDVGEVSGGEVLLRPAGKVSFVNFFATWCKPCKKEMPDLRKARSDFERSAVQFVSVTAEADETLVRQFWKEYGGTWPVAMDTSLEANKRWDVTGLPTNIVFDAQGKVVERRHGIGYGEITGIVESALEDGG